jgi:hypothetical protein
MRPSAHRQSRNSSISAALPKRLPVGARYVVEGRGRKDGSFQVFSRYVVLPGGRRINVPFDSGQASALSRPRPSRSTRRSGTLRAAAKKNAAAKKIFGRTGTARR